MRLRSTAVVLASLALLVFSSAATADEAFKPRDFKTGGAQPPAVSGVVEFRENLGFTIGECPQARNKDLFGEPLDRRRRDLVEQYSDGGDDRRTNEEFSCFPQNETSIDVHPNNRNIVAGVNDYRNGQPMSGFAASNDNGQTWYSGIIPFPTTPLSTWNPGAIQSGGDPVLVFDRGGVAYYANLMFSMTNDDNGIGVARSTNGGFTWSRICVPRPTASTTDPPDASVCGGNGDPRQPGDGNVTYQPDNDGIANFSVSFNDKEWLAAGPRPAGVAPTCFAPVTRTPIPPGAPGCPEQSIGVDRLHVTWTLFEAFTFPTCPIPTIEGPCTLIVASKIMHSYSDDRARSWAAPKVINGSASFCIGAFFQENACDDNQFSVPTVNQSTGEVWVAFENFNTEDENQILVVRSTDGGQTFGPPTFVTPVFDTNYPRAGTAGGRPDCTARGQQSGRAVLTNSCFRVPSTLAIVSDRRPGFETNVHIVMFDNRNGTRISTNADVFYFKSVDSGTTWVGPTRVNNDPSATPANFECGRTATVPNPNPPPPTITIEVTPPCPEGVHTGNDQLWPWIDVNTKGHLNITFSDRRLDLDSADSEWPTSRQRNGNYLVWHWGAQCTLTRNPRSCVAPGAVAIPQPTDPINPSGEQTQPGQGPAFLGPWRNFGISDFPSNWDYGFRAGIFLGDYHQVAVTETDTKTYAYWTDARNGRSSRMQSGRNPACEQSDPMVDEYATESPAGGQEQPKPEDKLFVVTPCPPDATQP